MAKTTIDRAELSQTVAAYLETQSPDDDDSWYVSSREAADVILTEFANWLYKEDDEKAARHAQYLKLKEEFES